MQFDGGLDGDKLHGVSTLKFRLKAADASPCSGS